MGDAFEDQDCITCFIKFRVPVGFTQARRNDKKTFYCPNGHNMAYSQSEADKLRLERDRLKQQLAQKDDDIALQRKWRREEHEAKLAAERQARAFKGVATRMKNRAAAGVCPCCNRTFVQLQRHMANKHPTFKAEEIDPEGATIQ